jgi:4'-phosphopantetheinyl transferase EntD
MVEVCPLGASMDDLHPSERAHVAGAVASRQREFAAGRAGARRLLGRLGLPDATIAASAERDPIWPPGFLGSISHTRDTCVVAVARRGAVRGLGVDIEADLPIEGELWPMICTGPEIRWLGSLPFEARGRAVRVVFSAKEAIYKCIFPLLRRMIGFDEVSLDISIAARQFSAVPCGLTPGDLRRNDGGGRELLRGVEGRLAFSRGLIFSGAFLREPFHA